MHCAAAVPLLQRCFNNANEILVQNFFSSGFIRHPMIQDSGFYHSRVIKTDSHTHHRQTTGQQQTVAGPGDSSRVLVGRRTHAPPFLRLNSLFLSEFNRIPVTPLCATTTTPSLRCVVCVWMCVSKACTPLSLVSAARLHQPASTRPMSLRCPVPPRPRVGCVVIAPPLYCFNAPHSL